jgi:ArsR family transcriptional regulator
LTDVNINLSTSREVRTVTPGATAADRSGVSADCCAPITQSALGEHDAAEMAGVFAALSDPVRLRLLSIVAAQGEVCSCNLEEPLGKSQPTISHHTRVLAEAGLIEGEKRGRWTWWHLVPAQVERLRGLLGES